MYPHPKRHLVVKNGNMRFVLLELILADQLPVLPLHPVGASNGQEWQYEISTVRAHTERSTGRSTTPVEASSGQEWQFHSFTVRAHIDRSTGRSTTPVEASSGQEWQYEISTVRAYIGRSTGKSSSQ